MLALLLQLQCLFASSPLRDCVRSERVLAIVWKVVRLLARRLLLQLQRLAGASVW